MQMSPVEVCTFTTGPPPFSLPSAVSVFGPHFAAFAADVDVGEIRRDAVSVAHIDAGTHIDGHIRRKVDRDVARARLQVRIVPLSPRIHQLHCDAARAGFRLRRRHAVQLDPAAPGLGVNVSLGRGQMDGPAPSLNFRRTANIAEINAAAARRNFYLTVALAHFDAAAARLNGRALRALNLGCLRRRSPRTTLPLAWRTSIEPPPVCSPRSPLTVPTSIAPPPVSALTPPPMSSRCMLPPPLSASTPPGNARRFHVAAFRLKLHQRHFARNRHSELRRKNAADVFHPASRPRSTRCRPSHMR